MSILIGAYPNRLHFFSLKLYLVSSLFITGNLVLPIVAHYFGLAGQVFLPIYFFSLLGGLLFGWRCGLLVGLLSPLISYLISGMPLFFILPFVVFKSVLLGTTSGYLREKWHQMNPFFCAATVIFSTQALGILFIYLLTKNFNLAFADIKIGFPGLLLQLILTPAITSFVSLHEEKNPKSY